MTNAFTWRGVSALAFALVAASSALAQNTINVASANSMDALGDPDNVSVTYTVPAGATYLLGNTVTFNAGTLDSVAAGTFATEARFRITSSAHPGAQALCQPVASGGTFTSVSLTAGTSRPLTGSLVGLPIAAGTTLTIEFYESFDDASNAADAAWTGLDFTTTVYTPPAPPSATDLGTLAVPGLTRTDTLAANEVKWFKFTLGTAATGARYLDIDNNGSTLDLTQDTSIGVYGSNGIRVASDTFSGFNAAAALSFGTAQTWGIGRNATAAGSLRGNGQNGSLPAGVYYMAVAAGNATFTDGFLVTPGTSGLAGDVKTNMYWKDAVEPPAVPTSGVTDLGTLSGTNTVNLTLGEVETKWYKFTVSGIGGGITLQIDTEGTTAFLPVVNSGATLQNDTQIGLWSSTGAAVANDDDSGVGFTSLLKFGDGEPDGPLANGTYYLSVGGFSTEFALTKAAVATSSNCSGDVVLKLEKGGAPGATITGQITLQNSDSDWSNEAITIEVFDPFSQTIIETITNVALDATGNYTAGTVTPDGQYDLYIKGDTFLRKLVSGVNFFGGASGVNATLTNGDVNNDNEVGPADFTILSGAFGSMLGDPNFNDAADLNDDDEVGPADFTILSTQFGNQGD